MFRALAFAAVALLGGCKSKPAKQLDLDAIRVTGDARLRTDKVGDGQFASQTTFVLVDAENVAKEGAHVTLGGDLTSSTGEVLGHLKPQSLWIPGGEKRTFALVENERLARPESTSARIVVKGALLSDEPPRARITDLHVFDDYGKVVVQANLVNDADRIGQIMVIAAFHDPGGRPMTRPFQMIAIDKGQTRPVQFVGPPGSKTGTIFVGDVIY
ncbi:MAG: hypothetical protein H0T46_23495 [Deltaproteobacteria bacterium]|nr:hypothetical protein [Deltaproteobacteria bacterium]